MASLKKLKSPKMAATGAKKRDRIDSAFSNTSIRANYTSDDANSDHEVFKLPTREIGYEVSPSSKKGKAKGKGKVADINRSRGMR